MTSEKLNNAIQMIKKGEKKAALPLLKEIVKEDPKNENAWLALSLCIDKYENKKYCLEQALKINPGNVNTQNALKKIEPKTESEIFQKQNQIFSVNNKTTDQPKKNNTHDVPSKKKLNIILILGIPIACLALIVLFIFFISQTGIKEIIPLGIFTTTTHTSTVTHTSTITPTNTTTPTYTISPTKKPTNTRVPTSTKKPTSTPIPGGFNFPLKMGDTISLVMIPEDYRKNPNVGSGIMNLTLTDLAIGEEANTLAKSHLGWSYKQPIEDQEYLAIYVKIKFTDEKNSNETTTLYSYFSLTLRYDNNGSDIWSEDFVKKLGEGYPPIEGEGWVFYLIRKGSKPMLYFQPNLISLETIGVRNVGVYFKLFD